VTAVLGSLQHSQEPWKTETEKVEQEIELDDINNKETSTHYFQSEEITLLKQIGFYLNTE